MSNKYEFKTGEKDFKQTMDTVSKRRDNADIVKYIYTGVIDILEREILNYQLNFSNRI